MTNWKPWKTNLVVLGMLAVAWLVFGRDGPSTWAILANVALWVLVFFSRGVLVKFTKCLGKKYVPLLSLILGVSVSTLFVVVAAVISIGTFEFNKRLLVAQASPVEVALNDKERDEVSKKGFTKVEGVETVTIDDDLVWSLLEVEKASRVYRKMWQ